jgi:hypothetical protein
MSEPLDIIAESYRGIHESTQMIAQAITRMGETNQILAQTQLRMEDTQHHIAQTQRGLAWLQGFACVLMGLSFFFLGYLVVQHFAQRQETATLQQLMLHNTQIIEAHTKAILDRMSRPQ